MVRERFAVPALVTARSCPLTDSHGTVVRREDVEILGSDGHRGGRSEREADDRRAAPVPMGRPDVPKARPMGIWHSVGQRGAEFPLGETAAGYEHRHPATDCLDPTCGRTLPG